MQWWRHGNTFVVTAEWLLGVFDKMTDSQRSRRASPGWNGDRMSNIAETILYREPREDHEVRARLRDDGTLVLVEIIGMDKDVIECRAEPLLRFLQEHISKVKGA